MNDKQEQPTSPVPADDTQLAADAHNESSKKPYKKPTISRHGNLRLMTQLE